jgi:plasmid stability protein
MAALKITLDDKLQTALKARAKRDGKTVNALIAELIDAYVKRAAGTKGRKSAEDDFVRLPPASFSDWDSDDDGAFDSL